MYHTQKTRFYKTKKKWSIEFDQISQSCNVVLLTRVGHIVGSKGVVVHTKCNYYQDTHIICNMPV